MFGAVVHLVYWLAPPTVVAAATNGLRRRYVEDTSPTTEAPSGHPKQSRAQGGPKPGAALAAAAVLLLVLLTAAGLAGIRNSWGNRWLLQRSCKPPGASERLGAWGELHGLNHTISTQSGEAQRLFNQGLLLAWDFNRAESQESFQACLTVDPGAAMCHWGLAYALGPYLNVMAGSEKEGGQFPVFGPRKFQQAHEASQKALELAQQAVQKDPASALAQRELAFCSATAARFAEGTQMGPAREGAERAYAEAMQALGDAEEDATALALAAEGYLNLCPWDFVEPSSGAKREGARAAETLLLRALRLCPRHELALHLHVHLAEAGAPADIGAPQEGSLGEQSADRLARLQPRMGHLQHMPSHLYIRVGRYHDAVRVNFGAYAADVEAARGCLQSYLPEHNLQMLLFAASMAGQYRVVEEWSAKMWALPEVMPHSAWPRREYSMVLLAKVRFAMWDKILAARPPSRYERGPGDPGGRQFATATWHYARCLALASMSQRAQQTQHAALGRRHRQEAEAELGLLQAAVASLPPDVRTRPGQGVGIYSPGYIDLGAMAVRVAEARLLALDGRWHETTAALQSAAEAEQGMGYIEPPRLLQQPLLQCLGWAYLHMGRYDAAAEAYRRDLSHHPGNGWALLGLSQALMHSGHSMEAAEAREAFQRAWQHADQHITSSCPAFAAGGGS